MYLSASWAIILNIVIIELYFVLASWCASVSHFLVPWIFLMSDVILLDSTSYIIMCNVFI